MVVGGSARWCRRSGAGIEADVPRAELCVGEGEGGECGERRFALRVLVSREN